MLRNIKIHNNLSDREKFRDSKYTAPPDPAGGYREQRGRHHGRLQFATSDATRTHATPAPRTPCATITAAVCAFRASAAEHGFTSRQPARLSTRCRGAFVWQE